MMKYCPHMIKDEIQDWIGCGELLAQTSSNSDVTKRAIDEWFNSGGELLHKAIVYSSKLEDPLKVSETESFSLVCLLLKQGVKVDVRNANQATPLHVAARSDNLKLVCLLVANEAKLEAKNKHNATPLHNASREGSSDIVSFLIHSGSEIDAQTDDGDTPLHQAMRKDKVDNVRILVSAGANKRIKNRTGYRAGKLQCEPGTKLAYTRAVFEKEHPESFEEKKETP